MHRSLFSPLMLVMLLTHPVTQASPIDQLQKVGEAKLQVLFWDIYQSELYSQTGTFEPNAYPLALKIRYLRDIKAEDLVENTAKQWKKLGYNEEQTTPWLEQVAAIWPDISEGDELLLVVNKQGGSDFYFNQEIIGSLPDKAFGPLFLSIWLSENSSYPRLRRKLIGVSK